MATTPEQSLKMLDAIKVPVEFAGTSASFQAGVLKGRTDVLEDLGAFAQALLAKAESEKRLGHDVEAQRTAKAGGAIASFSQNYIQRMREGLP